MKKNKKASSLILVAQGFLLFHLLWFLLALLLKTPAFPSPFKTYEALPGLIDSGLFFHFQASLSRVIFGTLLSLILGGALGIAMGAFPKVDQVLFPLVYFSYPVPKLALLPVLLVIFGLGNTSKLVLIVLITVFPVLVSARDATKNIDREYYDVLTSLGAGRLQRLFHVTLPAIMPEIFVSIKITIGTSLSVLFFAENYGTKVGLGYFIQNAWMRLDYQGMFAGIAVLGLMGFVLFLLLDYLSAFFKRG